MQIGSEGYCPGWGYVLEGVNVWGYFLGVGVISRGGGCSRTRIPFWHYCLGAILNEPKDEIHSSLKNFYVKQNKKWTWKTSRLPHWVSISHKGTASNHISTITHCFAVENCNRVAKATLPVYVSAGLASFGRGGLNRGYNLVKTALSKTGFGHLNVQNLSKTPNCFKNWLKHVKPVLNCKTELYNCSAV